MGKMTGIGRRIISVSNQIFTILVDKIQRQLGIVFAIFRIVIRIISPGFWQYANGFILYAIGGTRMDTFIIDHFPTPKFVIPFNPVILKAKFIRLLRQPARLVPPYPIKTDHQSIFIRNLHLFLGSKEDMVKLLMYSDFIRD